MYTSKSHLYLLFPFPDQVMTHRNTALIAILVLFIVVIFLFFFQICNSYLKINKDKPISDNTNMDSVKSASDLVKSESSEIMPCDTSDK